MSNKANCMQGVARMRRVSPVSRGFSEKTNPISWRAVLGVTNFIGVTYEPMKPLDGLENKAN